MRRVVGEVNEELYSTPEDALATAEALGRGGRGRYILAAAFGNVHGVYSRTRRIRRPWNRPPRARAATLGDMLAADG